MKIILTIITLLALAFIIIQIYASMSQQNIESYAYSVDKKYDGFEIRTYEASLFTSVDLSTGKYGEASSQGFSILAGYIFGGNESIAMTSPVTMSLEEDDSMTMMFMVPKKFNKENLPKPNQSGIEFKEMPAKTVAAIRFGVWADDEKIEKYKQQLMRALDAADISYSNRFYFYGYNPPYELFNRRNEVIIELNSTTF